MKNLVIADDHLVLRQALCELIESRGYHVTAQASDGAELLNILKSHPQNRPDLVIMDLAMPNVDGIAALEEIKKDPSAPPVLVLSADEGERKIRSALNAGARGYVPKNAGIEELEFAINSILNGKTYLSPSITAQLVTPEERPAGAPLSVLTRRELEILAHLADGKPNRVIGKLLHISTRTVDTHRSNILKKLKVKTNAELVKLAIAHGVITL